MQNNKYCKLILVEVNDSPKKGKAGQSNKFYEMFEENGMLKVKYGRVESTVQTASYSLSQWNSKYNEKIRKGYKDVTHTVTVEVKQVEDVKYTNSGSPEEEFLFLMKKYTDGLVSKTYTVKAQSVTQKQVDNAQEYLNQLVKLSKNKTTEINNLLLQLYMEIPRRMGNVRDYLLPNINLEKVLQQEQDNLDAMASQVSMISTDKKKKTKKNESDLLSTLGIKMKKIDGHSNIQYLVDQLNKSKIKAIFEIQKEEHDKVFEEWMKKQKNSQKRYLLHGTKCTSVIPIIEQGLKIRPSGNYQFSGKVYGEGNYFSETCSKSLNYTGYDQDQVLLIYEVHTGNPFVYNGWYIGNSFKLDYKNLQERGFDSTFVKAGGGLLNTEIIVYKEEQCRIKYIIHLKR